MGAGCLPKHVMFGKLKVPEKDEVEVSGREWDWIGCLQDGLKIRVKRERWTVAGPEEGEWLPGRRRKGRRILSGCVE